VYWFWWQDQGANAPITVKGTLSVSGMPGMGTSGSAPKIDFTLQTIPNKVRVSGDVQGQKVSAIVDLSKRTVYVLNDSKRKYGEEEFEYVDMPQTELHGSKDETWPKEFKRTSDWEYIGAGDGRRFCNKQTFSASAADAMDAAKGIPGISLPQLPATGDTSGKVEGEMWFTAETRLGKRHFSTLNKLTRIREVGKGTKTKEKRPQYKYVNLDFFPIPMKGKVSSQAMGMRMTLQMDAKSLSRKKISKDVFEVPSGYTKVDIKEVMN
jgi:hypothetical protein